MPQSLELGRYLDVIRASADALIDRATTAGLAAPVPTCPRWTVADLVAHQGMVHRWAGSNLRLDGATIPTKSQVLREVPRTRLPGWFRNGVTDLLATLRDADPDVPAMVFLKDAPAPREFWARRQAHETTIHAMDALAASLGHHPTEQDAGIDRGLALDGIDELVCGFITRGRSRLAGVEPFTIAVSPTDSDGGWTLDVRPEGIVTDPVRSRRADATFTGTAAQLYLGLWNRGLEITATGRPGVLDRWHGGQRVRWS